MCNIVIEVWYFYVIICGCLGYGKSDAVDGAELLLNLEHFVKEIIVMVNGLWELNEMK